LLALPAFGQQPMPVIGYLGAETPELFASRLEAFRRGLAEMNYVEGKTVTIEYRWAKGDNSRLPALANELAARPISVLVAPGSIAAALAAKKATSTIPVVFEMGADPVAAGLVQSFNHPGANVTGVTSMNQQLGAKRLQLLRDIVPTLRTFALLVNPTTPTNAETNIRVMQEAADAHKLRFHVVKAGTPSELAVAFGELSRLKVDGVVVSNDSFLVHRSREIAQLALRRRLPAVHQPPEFVLAGGLVSYAGNTRESHRAAGVHTGRVLHGESPATLPVQQVTETEMYVNARTAKALGLAIPQSILLRADKVIE
jgi:putative ABC transport system substrate-binding protein